MRSTAVVFGLMLTAWSLTANTAWMQAAAVGFVIDQQPIIRQQFVSTPADSLPTAKVVLYRPHDQLKRKYTIEASGQGAFSLSRQEEKVFDTTADKMLFSISAIGHRRGNFTFVLSKQKTHYFRVQDRNNYAGFQPFLEVIEVTEQTYRDDVGRLR